ncbi:hypothetical protein [Tepidibacillus marianensis]|uniref:hypothetical protein n=1 Tax=Tepidibacillus marianensis TaxID=3131995 RepID=UPI0030D48C69
MAFLKFILYVVIFFGISTITQMVYTGLKRTRRFKSSWLAPILAVVTIFVWMVIPSSWFIILLFALTVGVAVSEKEKVGQRKLF